MARTGVMADEVDPSSLLNSACYRRADFIFAISARAHSASSAQKLKNAKSPCPDIEAVLICMLENEFPSGTAVSMSYNYL